MTYKTTDIYEAAYFQWKGIKPKKYNILGDIIEWEFAYEQVKDLQATYHNQLRDYVSNVIKLKSFATKTKQKRRRKYGITK